MKIQLKTLKSNKILNKKNIYFIIVLFLIIGFIYGIIYYNKMTIDDKILVKDNIYSYFNYINITTNYNFINLLKTSIINNLLIIITIWILGISIVGIPIILYILFIKSFTLGFSITTIIAKFNLSGVVASIAYIFPDKISNIILISFLGLNSLVFSYNLILHLFFNKKQDIKLLMKKYLKILLISIIISLVLSLLEVFINPFIIKLFTFLEK